MSFGLKKVCCLGNEKRKETHGGGGGGGGGVRKRATDIFSFLTIFIVNKIQLVVYYQYCVLIG